MARQGNKYDITVLNLLQEPAKSRQGFLREQLKSTEYTIDEFHAKIEDSLKYWLRHIKINEERTHVIGSKEKSKRSNCIR